MPDVSVATAGRLIGTMLTTLDVSFGGGRASAHLDVSRSGPAEKRGYLGAVALALIAPMVAVFAGAALASAGWRVLDPNGWLGSEPRAAVVALVLIGPLVALVLLAAARLRFSQRRGNGRWHGRVTLQLARGELVAALLGVLLLGLFAAHLAADAVGCLGGVRSAC